METDLPEPDSPTSPRVSPSSTAKDTPLTAWTTPSCVTNSVRKFRTSSRLLPIMPPWGFLISDLGLCRHSLKPTAHHQNVSVLQQLFRFRIYFKFKLRAIKMNIEFHKEICLSKNSSHIIALCPRKHQSGWR